MNDKFTLEDTTKLATTEYEIDFDKENFNIYDFNFIVNEMYRIFHGMYQEDISKYIELALSWLDYTHGKALWYYKKMYE